MLIRNLLITLICSISVIYGQNENTASSQELPPIYQFNKEKISPIIDHYYIRPTVDYAAKNILKGRQFFTLTINAAGPFKKAGALYGFDIRIFFLGPKYRCLVSDPVFLSLDRKNLEVFHEIKKEKLGKLDVTKLLVYFWTYENFEKVVKADEVKISCGKSTFLLNPEAKKALLFMRKKVDEAGT